MRTLTRVRVWLVLFMLGLILSGVTAFPLEAESGLLVRLLHAEWSPAIAHLPGFVDWVDRVHQGIAQTNQEYPFMAYGTDWLAFAHLVIAVAFWGPLRDPVRNIWVVHLGMIACAAVVPLALIAGLIRGIPWWWQLIDIVSDLRLECSLGGHLGDGWEDADRCGPHGGAAAATRCSGRCRWPLRSRQAGIGMGCSRQSVDVAVRVLIS